MRKLFFLVVLVAIGFNQKSLAQDSTQQTQLYLLLGHYYDIKDGLLAGNSTIVLAKAEEFIKTANSIDFKLIFEGNINTLLKDASAISGTTDLKLQRKHFSNLSTNIALLATTIRFSRTPIYHISCPVEKLNWLSRDKVIKNPYDGSSNVPCGKTVEIVNLLD